MNTTTSRPRNQSVFQKPDFMRSSPFLRRAAEPAELMRAQTSPKTAA
jgi:hypothetical protein